MRRLHLIPLLLMLLLTFSAGAQVVIQLPTERGGGNMPNRPGNYPGIGQPSGYPQGTTDTTQQEDNEPKGIDYDHVEETDSALIGAVVQFHRTFRGVGVENYQHPSFSPNGRAYPDNLYHVFAPYYLSAGTMGHAHQSLWVTPYTGDYGMEQFLGRWSPFSMEGYAFTLPEVDFYQTSRPYTRLGYGGSLNKDNTLTVSHTQNVKPGWNIALDYSLLRRDGQLTRSGVSNNSLAFTTNYFSRDARYQLQAALIYNNLYNEENGGVASDEQYIHSGHSNLAGIPVVLYNASSRHKMFEAYIHQTFNTVRQFDRVDTVWVDSTDFRLDTLRAASPKTFNSGVFGLDLHFAHLNRTFQDRGTGDSIARRLGGLRADLYWTNRQIQWNLPLTITLGVSADMPMGSSPTPGTYASRLVPFAQVAYRSLFSIEADYDVLSGDYRAAARVGRKGFSLAVIASDCRPQWQFEDLGKMEMQKAEASYKLDRQWFAGRIALSAANARRHYWLDNQMLTQTASEATPLLQATVQGSLRLGWFRWDMQHLGQYADQALIRCPLYASKNSLYADFQLFHNALHANVGFDLRYHTAFFADAYDPASGLFYRQDEVQVGNYPWVDAFVTLRIKQAHIYLRVNHLASLLMKERRDFLLPHHPADDLGVMFGLMWQFFN